MLRSLQFNETEPVNIVTSIRFQPVTQAGRASKYETHRLVLIPRNRFNECSVHVRLHSWDVVDITTYINIFIILCFQTSYTCSD